MQIAAVRPLDLGPALGEDDDRLGDPLVAIALVRAATSAWSKQLVSCGCDRLVDALLLDAYSGHAGTATAPATRGSLISTAGWD